MFQQCLARLRIRFSQRFGFLIIAAASLIVAVSMAPAAEEPEYKPPGDFYSMEAHLKWCAEAKTVATRTKRYEGFWSQQAPKERDGYDDSLHIRLVRRCAYRLAELYAESGRKKECLKMLKWLETEDDSFDVEKAE